MKSYRKGWIAFSILLLLIGCQHQPAEIGLTTVCLLYTSYNLLGKQTFFHLSLCRDNLIRPGEGWPQPGDQRA